MGVTARNEDLGDDCSCWREILLSRSSPRVLEQPVSIDYLRLAKPWWKSWRTLPFAENDRLSTAKNSYCIITLSGLLGDLRLGRRVDAQPETLHRGDIKLVRS